MSHVRRNHITLMGKTHKIPYRYRSFSQKSPINRGVFPKTDLQLKASYGVSPICKRESCQTYESMTCHVTRMNESYERVRSHICMSHATHTNEACHPYERSIWVHPITHVNEWLVTCHACVTHCDTLRHTATHCNIIWMHPITHVNEWHITCHTCVTHCDTLRHTATHCNNI